MPICSLSKRSLLPSLTVFESYLQDELEKLNKHTEEINKLELQLEDANCLFRTLLTDSTQQLKALSQKVGKKKIILNT